MKNILIYVLCYNDKTEKQANDEFSQYDWARVYHIKEQNHLFEGVMFRNELMDMYDEWKDKDYVGTISYSIFSKVNKEHFFNLLETADPAFHDVVFFMQNSNSFSHESFHGKVGYILDDCLEKTFKNYETHRIVKKHKLSFLNKHNESYSNKYKTYAFCNYFFTTPKFMRLYIDFFKNKWLPLVENHPNVFDDSKYLGKLSSDDLVKLCGKPYYTCHAFVNERALSPFFLENNARII